MESNGTQRDRRASSFVTHPLYGLFLFLPLSAGESEALAGTVGVILPLPGLGGAPFKRQGSPYNPSLAQTLMAGVGTRIACTASWEPSGVGRTRRFERRERADLLVLAHRISKNSVAPVG